MSIVGVQEHILTILYMYITYQLLLNNQWWRGVIADGRIGEVLMVRAEVSCVHGSQRCWWRWQRWKCWVEVSGVNSEDGGVMCTWVTKVSAAMVEVEVSGDDGQHEVSSVMSEVEVSGGGVRCQQRGQRCQQRRQRCWVLMMTKGVSREVVSMAAVGKC